MIWRYHTNKVCNEKLSPPRNAVQPDPKLATKIGPPCQFWSSIVHY